MNNTAQDDIQRALSAIRDELNNEDIAALHLLLRAYAGIIASARALNGQNEVQIKQTENSNSLSAAQFSKPKSIATSEPKPPGTIKTTKPKKRKRSSFAAIKPKPPV